ncbi:MAG: helix-turn-helix domain-containing protein [Bacteroidota bacterium]
MKAFFVAGIGIALLIELLLVSKKNKSESDKILTLWMFLILVHLFLFYIYITEDIYNVSFLLGFEQPFPLLHGVLLYFYVSFVTKQLPEKRWTFLLHFIPACVVYLYLVPFFSLPPDQKIHVYRNHGAGYELYGVIKWYAIACSGVFYVIWSAVLLKRHGHNIRDQFSDLEKINLRWLQILTFGMGCIWFLVLFFSSDILINAGVVVFVFLIGFFGIQQTDIFSHGPSVSDSDEQKEKYQKSGLTDEAAETLHQELKRLMTEEALYKKAELSIDDLSSKLGAHPNYLSQVINQKEKKNFYDFVNTYRIEEFKRLISLSKNQQFTLLSLAYDCGFSSKTSFNRFFKKATGQTPSQYTTQITGIQIHS